VSVNALVELGLKNGPSKDVKILPKLKHSVIFGN